MVVFFLEISPKNKLSHTYKVAPDESGYPDNIFLISTWKRG